MKKLLIIFIFLFLCSCTSTMQYNRNLNKSVKYLNEIIDFLDPNICEYIRDDVIIIKNKLEELKKQ